MRALFTLLGFLSLQFLAAQNVHNLSDNPIKVCQSVFTLDAFEDLESTPTSSLKNSCLGDMDWLSSVWLSVRIEESGIFSFDLTPLQGSDDLDFVVYRAKDPLSSIGQNYSPDDYTLERCMASGLRLDQPKSGQIGCDGKTGLTAGAKDNTENIGCQSADDNYVRAISASAGDYVLILVTNYNSAQGFELRLTGAAKISEDHCQEISTQVGHETEEVAISPLHPNPVTDKAFIDVQMAKSGDVHLQVLRLDGSVVQDREMYMPAGKYQLTISARNLTPGTYLARLRIGQEEFTNKFIKLKTD